MLIALCADDTTLLQQDDSVWSRTLHFGSEEDEMVIEATVVFGQRNRRADIVNGEVEVASYTPLETSSLRKEKDEWLSLDATR